MAFVTHLDASSEANRRYAERRLVNTVFAAWSGRGAAFTVIVHNISETGFRAEFSSELRVGDEVRLKLGPAGYAPAEVVWRDGWDHGCRFLAPVSGDNVRGAIENLTAVVPAEEEPQAASEHSGKSWLGKRKVPGRKHRRIALLIVAVVVIGEAYLCARMLF